MRKINSNKGETLVETLAAIVVVTLAIILLTTSVVSAAKINRKTSRMDVLFNTTPSYTEETVKVVKKQFVGNYELNILRYDTNNNYSYWKTTGTNYPSDGIIDESETPIVPTVDLIKGGSITNSEDTHIYIPQLPFESSKVQIMVYVRPSENSAHIIKEFGPYNLSALDVTIVEIPEKTARNGWYEIVFTDNCVFDSSEAKTEILNYLREYTIAYDRSW